MASTLLTSIISFYNLDGDSTDNTGNGHDGTDTSISYVSGLIGQAASLNGTSSQINFGNLGSVPISGGFSSAIWFKTSTATTNPVLVSVTDNVSKDYQMRINADEFPFARLGSGSIDPNTPDVVDNTWTHMAAASDGTNLKLYVNGVQVGPTVTSLGTIFTTVLSAFGRYLFGSQFFNGLLTMGGFWSKELSLSEVQELYNSGAGNPFPFSVDYSNKSNGITPSKIDGRPVADIGKFNGI